MARRIGGEQYLLVPAHRITLAFVISDVVTFLIQGAGGGMLTNHDLANIGEKVCGTIPVLVLHRFLM
jgi:hypothetical protein